MLDLLYFCYLEISHTNPNYHKNFTFNKIPHMSDVWDFCAPSWVTKYYIRKGEGEGAFLSEFEP